MANLKEKLRNLRYHIAYMIAPDWIDDLEHRFSIFLCEQTGGMMSKCYYTTEAMRMCAEEYQMRCCDECEKEREAHWIIDGEWAECSNCHEDEKIAVLVHKDFCPACGAIMAEEEIRL